MGNINRTSTAITITRGHVILHVVVVIVWSGLVIVIAVLVLLILPILHVVVITVRSGLVIIVTVLVLLILLHKSEELVHQMEFSTIPIVISLQQSIDSFVGSSELGKKKFWGILLGTFSHSFLHLDSPDLHVLLPKATLHGLSSGPLLEFLVTMTQNKGSQTKHNKHLHP